jgi:hypothetical protein
MEYNKSEATKGSVKELITLSGIRTQMLILLNTRVADRGCPQLVTSNLQYYLSTCLNLLTGHFPRIFLSNFPWEFTLSTIQGMSNSLLHLDSCTPSKLQVSIFKLLIMWFLHSPFDYISLNMFLCDVFICFKVPARCDLPS